MAYSEWEWQLEEELQTELTVGLVRLQQAPQQAHGLRHGHLLAEDKDRRDGTSRQLLAITREEGEGEGRGHEVQEAEREVPALEGGEGVEDSELLSKQVP